MHFSSTLSSFGFGSDNWLDKKFLAMAKKCIYFLIFFGEEDNQNYEFVRKIVTQDMFDKSQRKNPIGPIVS